MQNTADGLPFLATLMRLAHAAKSSRVSLTSTAKGPLAFVWPAHPSLPPLEVAAGGQLSLARLAFSSYTASDTAQGPWFAPADMAWQVTDPTLALSAQYPTWAVQRRAIDDTMAIDFLVPGPGPSPTKTFTVGKTAQLLRTLKAYRAVPPALVGGRSAIYLPTAADTTAVVFLPRPSEPVVVALSSSASALPGFQLTQD